jgi:hypothetical protein
MIAVKPDWVDSSQLLGYHNIVSDKWVTGPLLQTIINANNEPQSIFVFCLDEMNLQRVEYYLAEVLSAIESGSPIILHNDPSLEQKGYPKTVCFPNNLYIIGTVNVDETVKQFSDKVLDRVDIIDLSVMDLPKLKTLLAKQYVGSPFTAEESEKAFTLLEGLHGELSNYRQEFGYRLFRDVFASLAFNKAHDLPLTFEQCLDQVIVQKVLPKIRGDERHEKMLDNLKTLLSQMPNSVNVIDRLKQQLQTGGFHFWN